MTKPIKKELFEAAILVALFMAILHCASCAADINRVSGVCRHNAAYEALTYHDLTSCEVRIAVGPWHDGRTTHAQAKALIDGKWQWLESWCGDVFIGKQDAFSPEKDYTVTRFIKIYLIP